MKAKVNNFNSDEKLLRYTDKLDYFFNGHKTLVVAEVDLTNRCNNNCPGCCGVNDNGAQMSRDQVDLVIDGLSALEARGVILSGGGEPLLSPHFEYAVDRIRKEGIKIGVNSNGLALTEKFSRIIAENAEYFRVSLDAATPELYLKTHGMPPDAFSRVVENCRTFVRVRREVGGGPSFGLGFLTSETTAGEMEAFVALARDIGADFAQFRPFTGDLLDVSDRIAELQAKYNSDTFRVAASMQKYREMKHGGSRDYDRCRGMFFSTVITADAKVFACLHYRQSPKHFVGQISGTNQLEDIFRSPRIREVYNSIDCAECPLLCRNDSFNRTLHSLAQDVTNKEFL